MFAIKIELLTTALEARRQAYAPYSKFLVGAAVLAADGTIYAGCNIENASFGLTICAERAAIFHAVSQGAREFVMLAVVADTPDPVVPCGACLQVMSEFGIPEVVMSNTAGAIRTARLSQCLPFAFDLNNHKI